MTDWLQYRINLVPRAPVNFQQKTNAALNNSLDPQIILIIIAFFRYSKWYLFCVVSYFYFGTKLDQRNIIEVYKYKNQ